MFRFLLMAIATVAGLVIVGMLGIWLLKAALGLIGYIIVGALIVGGAMYLTRRARRALGTPRQRQVRR